MATNYFETLTSIADDVVVLFTEFYELLTLRVAHVIGRVPRRRSLLLRLQLSVNKPHNESPIFHHPY